MMEKIPTLNHAKSRQEIANEFGISARTLDRWLKKHGILFEHQRLLTPKEQEEVYAALGNPMYANKRNNDGEGY